MLLRLLAIFLGLALVHLHVSATGTLIQLQVVTRHGIRTPIRSFPTDPYKEIYSNGGGFGQLTVDGARQMVDLGLTMRRKYPNLFLEHFDHRYMYVRSTNKARTIASAHSFLAGLFLNSDPAYHISSRLPWLPLPIHTKSVMTDVFSTSHFHCPKKDALIKKQLHDPAGKWKLTEAKWHDFIVSMGEFTGFKNMDLKSTVRVASLMKCWRAMNLSFPSWLTQQVQDKLNYLLNLKFGYLYNDPEINALTGGPPLGVLIGEMDNRLQGGLYSTLLYSAHDSTLSPLMHVLGVHNHLMPPFGSALLFELYSNSTVRVLFRNSSHSEFVLNIPTCPHPCSLQKLKKQYQSFFDTSLCGTTVSHTHSAHNHHLLLIGVLIITGFIFVALVSVVYILILNRQYLLIIPFYRVHENKSHAYKPVVSKSDKLSRRM